MTLTTIVADLAHYPIPPAAWDGIVSIFVHLPLLVRHQVHRQAAAGLKPGGVFILDAYTPSQLRTALVAIGGRIVDEARQPVCRSGWADTRDAHEIERDVVKGRYHTGRAAVVQVLARKS